jgi:hypothetical protein
VQVGEEDLLAAHPVILLLDRLLDLQDKFGLAPDVVGRVDDGGARRDKLFVGDGRARTGTPLDQNLMPVARELVHPGRGDRHPVLMVLDFLRYSYLHVTPFSGGGVRSRW